MNSEAKKEFNEFKNQLSYSISYQKFLCDYYKDDPTNSSNKNLLLGLYETQIGSCTNPALIMDLIFPAEAKMGRLRAFRPTTDKMNDSQRKAISMGLAMNNLMVIEGPPGTGKTTVISELIKQLKKSNNSTRILITSQSHLAVDNVLKIFLEKNEFLDQIARIRQKENIEKNLQEYSEEKVFEDIVSNSDEKLSKILESFKNSNNKHLENDISNAFDDNDNKRIENDFLNYNVSLILTNKSIVGVTCNSIPGCHFESGIPFDYVIVDEVGKFSFAELINVAKITKKLILIGDPNQLPAVLPNSDKENKSFSEIDGFDKSGYKYLKNNNYVDFLFENINKECKTMLNVQYRMSNAIGTFISHRFYNDNVSNGLDFPVEEAMVSISYDGDIEVEPRNLTNKFEIEIIKCLIEKLKSDNVNLENVAIIVPYRDQANLIAKEITAIPPERISTIDAYQGKEFDFIIFGCTRVNGGTKFLDDPKRINVAISRAKQKIFMIGHKETIRKTKNIKAFHNDKNCKRCKYENNRIK